MREFAVAMTVEVRDTASHHLVRADGDEDVCFALYRPSTGSRRDTAIIYHVRLPEEGERGLHGNVSFTTDYLRRVIDQAVAEGAGVALLHSHPSWTTGWQEMSPDDLDGEERHARVVYSRTGLPLVGMTLAAGDGSWSARRWRAAADHGVHCDHARIVRVVGTSLSVTINPGDVAEVQETQTRTVSFWGEDNQAKIASLTVAVVGLGSVGSIVAELLARTGVQRLILIDYDVVKIHNLDRTISAGPGDEGQSKVQVAARRLRAIATAANFQVVPVDDSVVEEDGYRSLLDADIAFCCVDRPWPRHVLNRAAYAHLIPVIDGGILVRFRPGGREMLNADWSVNRCGPNRPCLICQRAYSLEMVSLEQTGLLEDPKYIQGLPDDSPLKRRENVIALSASVASFEVLQMVAMVSGLMGLPDPGQQRYAYYPGNVRIERVLQCSPECMTPSFTALGDLAPAGTAKDHGKTALRTSLQT
jgi:molybdopterin-synthase adenylyltransferase